MRKRKRIFFILLTWGFLLIFAEVALQFFYRASVGMWLWEWWAIPIFETDPIRVYRLKANLDFTHKTREYTARYYTNPLGLRTDERRQTPAIPKPAGVFRILALGPSFAFGWGADYQDSYMAKIARGLQVPGRRVELMNLGTPSQPQSYQLKWLREEGARYQPDLIVLTVYGAISGIETNDVIPGDGVCVKGGYLYPCRQMTAAMWVRRWRRYSACLFYGWHAWLTISRPGTSAAGDGRELYRNVTYDRNAAATNTVREYKDYVRFVHGVLTNKPPVVFVFVPTAYAVRPADAGRVASVGRKADPLAEREAAAQLTAALCSNGVNLINTTTLLVERDKQARMFHLYDVHFTVEGNDAAAACALPAIQKLAEAHLER
jgi:hypothetical protein